MKFGLSDDIMRLSTAVLAILAALASFLIGESPLTYALAILIMFFLPGYALTRLIFHDKIRLDFFILLSIGLSVIVTMLLSASLAIIGILTQESSVFSLVGITLIAIMLDRLIHHMNRKFSIEIIMPRRDQIDPIIAVGIAFGIVLIGIFSYLILTSSPPSTTHIALLSDDMDIDLPTNTTVGSPVQFTLELKNGEGNIAEFRVEMFINGSITNQFAATLGDGEIEYFNLEATPIDPGYQQIRIEVYIDNVYFNNVHFWIMVFE